MKNLMSLNQMIALHYASEIVTVTFVIIHCASDICDVLLTRQVKIALLMKKVRTINQQ